jgi:adenosylmethionine-8-amino-7-oxononanoate aminotransferase
MGRTGTLHACEQEGVAPDLMAIAKGLGGGYQPVGAVLIGQKIIDAIAAGTGFFQHGHTYIGHPVACAAALAVQKVLKRDGLLQRCAAQGRRLRASARRGLRRAPVRRRHPRPGAVPGDRARGRPRHQGAVRPGAQGPCPHQAGGDGPRADDLPDGRAPSTAVRGDHVLLAPPFIVSDDELDLVIERLVEAVDASMAAIEADRV